MPNPSPDFREARLWTAKMKRRRIPDYFRRALARLAPCDPCHSWVGFLPT